MTINIFIELLENIKKKQEKDSHTMAEYGQIIYTRINTKVVNICKCTGVDHEERGGSQQSCFIALCAIVWSTSSTGVTDKSATISDSSYWYWGFKLTFSSLHSSQPHSHSLTTTRKSPIFVLIISTEKKDREQHF